MRPEVVGRLADGSLHEGGVEWLCAAAPATGRRSEVNASISWRAPYSAGLISSVIPASSTTWRATSAPGRSRTWRTRATSQPARATRKRPGSTTSRRGCRSTGIVSSSGASSRAKRSGRGPGLPSGPTGKPPPRSSVSKRSSPPRSRPSSARPRRTASRHASTAPSWEPTWRWIPRGTSAPSASAATRSTEDVSSVSVIPNFELAAPTASVAAVSGTTAGLRRNSTSSGGRSAVPKRALRAMAISASASSGDSIASQAGGAPVAAWRTARRRSASVLPIPSIVIRSCGTPARRAIAHSPPDTTFAPRPNPCSTATTPETSFALTENWRMIGSGNATASSAAAARRTATSVTNSGVPNRRAASRRPSAMSGRRSVSGGVPVCSVVVTGRQSLTTECATELTTPSTTAPTIAATIVSASKVGG